MNLGRILWSLEMSFLGIGLFWGIVGMIMGGIHSPLGPALFAVGMVFLGLVASCSIVRDKKAKKMNLGEILWSLEMLFLGIGLFWSVTGGLMAGAGFPLGTPLFTIGMIFMSLMLACSVVTGSIIEKDKKDKKEGES